jgi:hypothetical protein
VITGAYLAVEDGEILVAWVSLNLDDLSGDLGGYVLYTPEAGIRAYNYAGHFIYKVLEVAGVSRWDQLKGRAVRACCKGSRIEAIGHIIDDRWFFPEKDFEGLPEDDVPA